MVLIFFILFISISNIFSGNIQDLIRNIIPQKIWMEFSPEGFKDLDVSRLQIFYSAFKIMLLRPFVGVGAASFTAIYELQNNFWKGHSHNLIIELGISYGIPVALILFFTISKLLYLSCIEIFKNNKNIEYFERAWWASIFFFDISTSRYSIF